MENRLITFDNAAYNERELEIPTGETKTNKKVLVKDNKEEIKVKDTDEK